MLEDSRIPARPPVNQFGFEVHLSSVPLNDFTVVEGYFGNDSKLYAHTVETTGGTLTKSGVQVSIQRTQCRNEDRAGRDQIEVRGAVTVPAGTTPGTVTIWQANAAGARIGTTPVGSAAVVVDAEFPGFATYRVRNTALTFASCPPKVRAEYNRGTPPPTVATADLQAL